MDFGFHSIRDTDDFGTTFMLFQCQNMNVACRCFLSTVISIKVSNIAWKQRLLNTDISSLYVCSKGGWDMESLILWAIRYKSDVYNVNRWFLILWDVADGGRYIQMFKLDTMTNTCKINTVLCCSNRPLVCMITHLFRYLLDIDTSDLKVKVKKSLARNTDQLSQVVLGFHYNS